VTNDKLCNILRKGPKYREPKHINWNQNFKLLMDSVEDYARKWAKKEGVELDTLSDWVTSIRSLIRKRIFKLSRSMSSKVRFIFNDKDVIDNLTDLHNKYVVVPADIASNNIVFVCKTYYIDCLVNNLGINNNTGNPTYTPTPLSKDEILFNHKSVISFFGLSIKVGYYNLYCKQKWPHML